MKIFTRQILRVSMKLFCRSTESQREFMKKIAARNQLWTIYNHFSSFGIPENGLGVLFSRKQLVMYKKNRRQFQVYGKGENAYFHVETESGSRQT